MAYPNLTLIAALRNTATKLKEGAYYAWGHHGGCNCGNLLHVVTSLSKEEILQYAHSSFGEWSELAEDYCEVSSTPAYLMISKLQEIGLTSTDIHNLEYLEDREVLGHLPGGFKWLKRNVREDVILYLESFANMLEEKLERSVKVDYELLLSESQTELV
ncbi:MAG TPA: hypothetical protein VFV08_16190 [Puia sp.]|nr:hypothetical protein [Puia sp.]